MNLPLAEKKMLNLRLSPRKSAPPALDSIVFQSSVMKRSKFRIFGWKERWLQYSQQNIRCFKLADGSYETIALKTITQIKFNDESFSFTIETKKGSSCFKCSCAREYAIWKTLLQGGYKLVPEVSKNEKNNEKLLEILMKDNKEKLTDWRLGRFLVKSKSSSDVISPKDKSGGDANEEASTPIAAAAVASNCEYFSQQQQPQQQQQQPYASSTTSSTLAAAAMARYSSYTAPTSMYCSTSSLSSSAFSTNSSALTTVSVATNATATNSSNVYVPFSSNQAPFLPPSTNFVHTIMNSTSPSETRKRKRRPPPLDSTAGWKHQDVPLSAANFAEYKPIMAIVAPGNYTNATNANGESVFRPQASPTAEIATILAKSGIGSPSMRRVRPRSR